MKNRKYNDKKLLEIQKKIVEKVNSVHSKLNNDIKIEIHINENKKELIN